MWSSSTECLPALNVSSSSSLQEGWLHFQPSAAMGAGFWPSNLYTVMPEEETGSFHCLLLPTRTPSLEALSKSLLSHHCPGQFLFCFQIYYEQGAWDGLSVTLDRRWHTWTYCLEMTLHTWASVCKDKRGSETECGSREHRVKSPGQH